MNLSRQRRFDSLLPGESFEAFAARHFPDKPLAEALDDIRSWNLHIFMGRRPIGQVLGSDVVFIEGPLAA